MSQRFGRKQKRAMRAEIEALQVRAVVAEGHYSTARRDVDRARFEMAQGRHNMEDILRDAKALVVGKTAQAIIEAENQFLREALSQLRAQGASSVTLEASLGPDFSGRYAEEEVLRFDVQIRPIVRSFMVEVPRSRRRA